MKKLFSTLGMMALVSLCLFSSCKDEDYPATETVTTATANAAQVNAAATAAANNAVAEALAAAQAAAPAGATVVKTGANEVTTTNADGTKEVTTTSTSYTYEVNGVSYDDMDAAMAALSKLPAGSTATIVAVLHQTTTTQKYNADGTKNGAATTKEDTAKGKETKIEVPEAGEAPEKVAVEVPTSVSDATQSKSVDVTVATAEKGKHSGGGVQ